MLYLLFFIHIILQIKIEFIFTYKIKDYNKIILLWIQN